MSRENKRRLLQTRHTVHFDLTRTTDNNKEKQLRRIKSTVTQSQVQESNDGHPLGKMLSGKMLAPSPAFQKALMGIADQKKENEDFSYDDIDWDTLPEEINHTRSHVQSLLGNRFGRRQSLDDSVVGIKVNNSRRRRGALDALDFDPEILLERMKEVSLKKHKH